MDFYPLSEYQPDPPDLAAMLEQFRADLPAMLDKAHARATQTSDALLTDAWKRLIGPAWKLVAAIQREVLTSNYVYQPGDHAFATLEHLAALAGVSERSAQRWLSKHYRGAQWLRVWLSWRVQYITRDDGLPCKAGTVFRLNLEPQPTHDITPAAKPRLEALKALWRGPEDLPANRSQTAEETGEEAITDAFSNNRQKNAGVKTFPQSREGFQNKIQVEGRDVSITPNTLISNTRQTQTARNAQILARLSTSSVHHTEAMSKAETAATRLNDKHSTLFWYTQFRHALTTGKGESTIWAAISNSIEARDRGLIRSKAGAYAVGVLNRTQGKPSNSQEQIFSRSALA